MNEAAGAEIWAHIGSFFSTSILFAREERVGAVREGGDDVEWVGKALRT